jgi:Protein phosphatase 2C
MWRVSGGTASTASCASAPRLALTSAADVRQVANAGDSRCVMCRGGRAVAMTVDHKPNDEGEHDRILKVPFSFRRCSCNNVDLLTFLNPLAAMPL